MFARVSMARQLSMLTTLCPMRNVSEPSAMGTNPAGSGSSNDLRCSPPIEAKTYLRRWCALHRRFLKGSSCRKQRRAFYSPNYDFIQVPRPEAYFEPINWHRTALHELGHWTGAAQR